MLTPPTWFGASVQLPLDLINFNRYLSWQFSWRVTTTWVSHIKSSPRSCRKSISAWSLQFRCKVWEGVHLCWHCDCTATCHGTRMVDGMAVLATSQRGRAFPRVWFVFGALNSVLWSDNVNLVQQSKGNVWREMSCHGLFIQKIVIWKMVITLEIIGCPLFQTMRKAQDLAGVWLPWPNRCAIAAIACFFRGSGVDGKHWKDTIETLMKQTYMDIWHMRSSSSFTIKLLVLVFASLLLWTPTLNNSWWGFQWCYALFIFLPSTIYIYIYNILINIIRIYYLYILY